MTALFNSDNWEAYLAAFRSHFRELNATDPDRFPRGKDCLFKSSQISRNPAGANYCDDKLCSSAQIWLHRKDLRFGLLGFSTRKKCFIWRWLQEQSLSIEIIVFHQTGDLATVPGSPSLPSWSMGTFSASERTVGRSGAPSKSRLIWR